MINQPTLESNAAFEKFIQDGINAELATTDDGLTKRIEVKGVGNSLMIRVKLQRHGKSQTFAVAEMRFCDTLWVTEIVWVSTPPQYRRQGFAAQAVSTVVQISHLLDVGVVRVVNVRAFPARRLFQSCGFVSTNPNEFTHKG